MKKCSKCGVVKELSNFYNHKECKFGVMSVCKVCISLSDKIRKAKNRANKEWRDNNNEKQRQWYMNNGHIKQKPEQLVAAARKKREKFPEKCKASDAVKKLRKKELGIHLHHWSYNKEHWLDIIELEAKIHIGFHRFIIYEQKTMMYRTLEGIILDTKVKHLNYFNKVKHLI